MSLRLFDLTGRRALVTGSSQGIGEALAKGLAAAGAEVILNGRDPDKLAKAADGLRKETGRSVHELAFDVTDHAGVRSAIDGFEASVGSIDILINNAGQCLHSRIFARAFRAAAAAHVSSGPANPQESFGTAHSNP